MNVKFLICHPDEYRDRTRVLFLKGRHKDGIEKERTVSRVTHSIEHFNATLEELAAMARPGERIYGSAGPRDVSKAAREFKHRQIDADADDDPLEFYRAIDARWVSCLMQPAAQLGKTWLFDCDTPMQAAQTREELDAHYDRLPTPYWYKSKSGQHCIVAPFDRSKLADATRALIHDNPIMLWMY